MLDCEINNCVEFEGCKLDMFKLLEKNNMKYFHLSHPYQSLIQLSLCRCSVGGFKSFHFSNLLNRFLSLF